MTAREGASMSARKNGVSQQPLRRPALVSQSSNSVPSTPLQYARDFGTRSRSPSPRAVLSSHSPRSVTSEANGALPSLRKARAHGCRYESGVVPGSRRRIPYSIGDAPLDKVEDVKKSLDSEEEKKLSSDMRELYDRLIPSPESNKRRSALVQKLERILQTEWPTEEFKVHVFGSSGNMLCTSESDVDICIQTPMKELEKMHSLASALGKNGMDSVVCVPNAKVPIVKIWDPELKLSCDMNVNNTLALENTRMIKTYVQIDDRVRPLAMIIKHWTKQRILNDAALGGTLSSYTWICMILNFLQTRSPPILPSLHSSPGRRKPSGAGVQSEFADDLETLRGFGKSNKETLGQLLFQFFRFYGHELDYEASVISVRNGRLLSRKEKKWHVDDVVKEGRDRLCVEEPFNVSRNLGNSADDTAFRGIHEEMRRAFDYLADGGRLTEACEQYEYPPDTTAEDNAGLFKKPTSTKAILTSVTPASARGGRGPPALRPRGSSNIKGSHMYNRRASSAASFGNNRTPFLQSPSLGPQEYVNDLHKQLFQQYQLLEQQKAQLYAHAQSHAGAHQAHFQAQLHAHHAQAHAHAQVIAQSQGRTHSVGGSPQMSGYTSGVRSPRTSESGPATGPLFPGYIYHYPTHFEQSMGMASSLSQDGTSRTSPSSPSLAATMPSLRRAVHRSSAASEPPAASVRSHSQPARVFTASQLKPGYPIPSIPQEYLLQPRHNMQQVSQESSSQPTRADPYLQSPNVVANLPQPALPFNPGIRKEYVGYYIGESPKPQDYTVAPIPSWNEIKGRQRQRENLPEIQHTDSLLPSSFKKYARSPSPLGSHFRSFSTGEGLGLGLDGDTRQGTAGRSGSAQPSAENGLLIVNGSYDPSKVQSRDEADSTSATTEGSAVATAPSDTSASDNAFPLDLPEIRQQQPHASGLSQRRDAGDEVKRDRASFPMPENGPIIVSSNPPGFAHTNTGDSSRGTNANGNADIMIKLANSEVQSQRRLQPPHGVQPIDTAKARETFTLEPKSTGLAPLLSPVLETRTPSPTANRALEARNTNQKTVLHAVPNGKPNYETSSHSLPPKPILDPKQSQKVTLPRIATDTNYIEANGMARSADTPQSGTWQKTNTKKRAKGKKIIPKANGESSKAHGEPLPMNEADRKGG